MAETIAILLVVAIWLCNRGMISTFNWLMDKLAIIYLGGMFSYAILRRVGI